MRQAKDPTRRRTVGFLSKISGKVSEPSDSLLKSPARYPNLRTRQMKIQT